MQRHPPSTTLIGIICVRFGCHLSRCCQESLYLTILRATKFEWEREGEECNNENVNACDYILIIHVNRLNHFRYKHQQDFVQELQRIPFIQSLGISIVHVSFCSYFSRNSGGTSKSSSSNASRKHRITSFNPCPPVICFVPDSIVWPSLLIIRRYPHQLFCNPLDHLRNAWLYWALLRSQVLKAAGTKYSSTIRWIMGLLNIIRPASWHPYYGIMKNRNNANWLEYFNTFTIERCVVLLVLPVRYSYTLPVIPTIRQSWQKLVCAHFVTRLARPHRNLRDDHHWWYCNTVSSPIRSVVAASVDAVVAVVFHVILVPFSLSLLLSIRLDPHHGCESPYRWREDQVGSRLTAAFSSIDVAISPASPCSVLREFSSASYRKLDEKGSVLFVASCSLVNTFRICDLFTSHVDTCAFNVAFAIKNSHFSSKIFIR